ncbi:MAG: hypothetical protein KDD73_11885 [Anaerolineales bacterium]|nr:hypothetical protein [Anaerolineales bacterium]MCB9126661.1 hypothetical protein [Ardenticatenales bacterium]MCB9171799.1 hypothetical protein [Ardenticatenales bacterium]
MNPLATTLAVRRPTDRWTTLFRHDQYAPALWALLFSEEEAVYGSRDGDERLVGFQTTVNAARKRLVARLEPLRSFEMAWRPLSLASALAICIAGIPGEWPLRFDAASAVRHQESDFGRLLTAAIGQAAAFAQRPPTTSREALSRLMAIIHGMNPETVLAAPATGQLLEGVWPADALVVEGALLGVPVECPTSHVDSMTRSRRRWQASW